MNDEPATLPIDDLTSPPAGCAATLEDGGGIAVLRVGGASAAGTASATAPGCRPKTSPPRSCR